MLNRAERERLRALEEQLADEEPLLNAALAGMVEADRAPTGRAAAAVLLGLSVLGLLLSVYCMAPMAVGIFVCLGLFDAWLVWRVWRPGFGGRSTAR